MLYTSRGIITVHIALYSAKFSKFDTACSVSIHYSHWSSSMCNITLLGVCCIHHTALLP